MTVAIPITITVDVGQLSLQSPADNASPKSPALQVSSSDDDQVFIERRVEDYANRTGYDSGFLGVEVPLPEVVDATDDVLPFEQDGRRKVS